MPRLNEAAEVNVYARLAGLAYLVIILLGIFSVNLITEKLVVPGDIAMTLSNIVAHGGLFRLGLASEIVMYALVILLAYALYVVLRPVNRNLALLALLWRVSEAIVGSALTVSSGILPLSLLDTGGALDTSQLYALLDALLSVRIAGLDVVLLFVGLGGTVFCYLFWKSHFVPRILAAWGIVTYLSMLMLALASLLTSIDESAKLILYAPGGLFEITMGLWLLFKGVTVKNVPGRH
jgi:hypothetical protein